MIRDLGYREMRVKRIVWADPNDKFERMAQQRVREMGVTFDQTSIINAPVVRRSDRKLFAGHDRVAAAELMKREHMLVHVMQGTDDEMAELAIVENLHRRRDDQDALRRQLQELRAARLPKQSVTQTPLRGRPKSPEGRARDELAPALQTTPAALKQAAYRDRKKERDATTPPPESTPANRDAPPPPIRSFGMPIAEHLRAEVEARQLHTDKADRLNQQLLAELTRMSILDPESNPKSRELHALFRIAGAQLRLARPEWLCPYCKGEADLPCMSCSGRRWWDASQITSAIPDELLLEGEQAHVVVDGRAPVPLAKWLARRAPNGEARGEHAR